MTLRDWHTIGFVCADCALRYGRAMRADHIATFHMAKCPVCGEEKLLTEPRDYRNYDSGKDETRTKHAE